MARLAYRCWWLSCSILFFWSDQCVRDLSGVLCHTPAQSSSCVDDIMDWLNAIMGLFLLGMSSILTCLIVHILCASKTVVLFSHG